MPHPPERMNEFFQELVMHGVGKALDNLLHNWLKGMFLTAANRMMESTLHVEHH
jgi:hypothetical protein